MSNEPDLFSDRIHIEQLEISARVGVPEKERAAPQRLTASITLWPQRQAEELHDHIAKTVNYSEVCEETKKFVRDHTVKLIETLAAELAHAGILTSEEREKIDKGLREIETEIENGKFEWDQSLEDVHMNIEAALTKRIGVAGAKLHTARSRNDQAALDLRLYVKAEIGEIRSGLRSLQSALLHLAEQ